MLPAPRPLRTRSGAIDQVRRHVLLHRRLVAGALAFCAVLAGMSAITSAIRDTNVGPVQDSTRSLAKDEVLVPLRLDDPDVSKIVSPGSVVDVLNNAGPGDTEVVATEVTIADVLTTSSGPWESSGGLIVVGATPQQALTLSAAQREGGLSIVVHP